MINRPTNKPQAQQMKLSIVVLTHQKQCHQDILSKEYSRAASYIVDFIYFYITAYMLHRNRHAKSLWRRKKSQPTPFDELDDKSEYQQLKSVSKRLAIMSRLQQKQLKNKQHRKTNKTFDNAEIFFNQPNIKTRLSQKRPATTKDTRKINNLNSAVKAFKQERKMNQHLMAQRFQGAVKTSFSDKGSGVKEGLLGQYQRYNQMTKQQLIEKLISLEYLANNIFRKNKALEQKIKNLDPNFS